MNSISFEFFPPKSEEAWKTFESCYPKLAELNPEYFSVTYGAGGSTRLETTHTVQHLRQQTPVNVVPHLSCIGATEASIREQLAEFKTQAIKQIVALRGDLPSGAMARVGRFKHASDLVAFTRQELGDEIKIAVAAHPEFHPETPDYRTGLEYFKHKVEQGADLAITQYFYSADAYFHFVDDCQTMGLDIPIIPGIMPITNFKGIKRFSNMCGAELPTWIYKRLEYYDRNGNAEELREFGIEVVSKLCQRLLDGGAPSLHFYTLNRAQASLRIYNNLV